MTYKIVGLQNHNIMLEYDGIRRNFPLPMVDGVYPTGAALTTLLTQYVANAREAQAAQDVKATNEQDVLNLVEVSGSTIRAQRRVKLQQSDWTQLPDCSLSTAKKQEWATYRQALRDITVTAGFPTAVVWPVVPA